MDFALDTIAQDNSALPEQDASKAKKQRSSRACLACRAVKVKCGSDGSEACSRCLSNGIECVFEKSKRGGRQPGAKNLKTLKAQGLIPADQDLRKAKKANKAKSALNLSSGQKQKAPLRQTPSNQGDAIDLEVPLVQERFGTLPDFNTGPLSPYQSTTSQGQDAFAFMDGLNSAEMPSFLFGEGLGSSQSMSSAATTSSLIPSPTTTAPNNGNNLDLFAYNTLSSLRVGPESETSPALAPNTSNAVSASAQFLQLLHPAHPVSNDRDDSAPILPDGNQDLDPQSVIRSAARSRPKDDFQELMIESPGSNTSSGQGVADSSYFKPGPLSTNSLPLRKRMIASYRSPEILKIISVETIQSLFGYYFANIHRHFPILDPGYHTVQFVTQRSPFLLTAICGIAAHFDACHHQYAQQIGAIAQGLAFGVPSRGSKTIEVIQAYLLLTVWTIGTPPARHEEDRTNLILGLAKSTATDLRMHRLSKPPPGAASSMAVQNEIRTYLFCYIRDLQVSVQLGSHPTMRLPHGLRNPDMYLPTPLSPSSIWICMMLDLYRMLSRTLDILYVDADLGNETSWSNCTFSLQQLEDQARDWKSRCRDMIANSKNHPQGEIGSEAQYLMLHGDLYQNFALLCASSFGLYKALREASSEVALYFNKCYTSVVTMLQLAKQSFISHAASFTCCSDNYFICISYAAISLLRFCRQKFNSLHNNNAFIIELVSSTANILQGVANPTARQYSSFIRALVDAHLANPLQTMPSTPRASSPINDDPPCNPAPAGQTAADPMNDAMLGTGLWDLKWDMPSGQTFDQLLDWPQWNGLNLPFEGMDFGLDTGMMPAQFSYS